MCTPLTSPHQPKQVQLHFFPSLLYPSFFLTSFFSCCTFTPAVYRHSRLLLQSVSRLSVRLPRPFSGGGGEAGEHGGPRLLQAAGSLPHCHGRGEERRWGRYRCFSEQLKGSMCVFQSFFYSAVYCRGPPMKEALAWNWSTWKHFLLQLELWTLINNHICPAKYKLFVLQESFSTRPSRQMRGLWWPQPETLDLSSAHEHQTVFPSWKWESNATMNSWPSWISTMSARGCQS